jgi:hypothetical protein
MIVGVYTAPQWYKMDRELIVSLHYIPSLLWDFLMCLHVTDLGYFPISHTHLWLTVSFDSLTIHASVLLIRVENI